MNFCTFSIFFFPLSRYPGGLEIRWIFFKIKGLGISLIRSDGAEFLSSTDVDLWKENIIRLTGILSFYEWNICSMRRSFVRSIIVKWYFLVPFYLIIYFNLAFVQQVTYIKMLEKKDRKLQISHFRLLSNWMYAYNWFKSQIKYNC